MARSRSTQNDVMASGNAIISARTSPNTVQLTVDEVIGVKAKATSKDNAGNNHGSRNMLVVAGIVAASSAIAGIAAGPISPAAAFGYFVVLLGGLSMAMASVHFP